MKVMWTIEHTSIHMIKGIKPLWNFAPEETMYIMGWI